MAIDIVARSLAVSVKQIAVVANSAITPGTHTKITYDSKGLVTGGDNLAASDIPNLPASKITSGTFADDRIASASTWNNKQNALTTTQLNAVNSGITSGKVSTYDGYQAEINAKYTKPNNGIPKTDLDSAVQTSLGKADSALQSHQTIKTGSANGTISVGGTDVAVKGLGTAAYKADTYFATAAGNNIFTGNNWFKGDHTYFMTASGGPNDPMTTIDANSVYCQSTGSELGTYYKDSQITHKNFTLTLPSKTGALATTGDIPSTSSFVTIADEQTIPGNKTFTGTNMFKGGTTMFMTAAGRPNDPRTTINSEGIHCQAEGNNGTYYKDGKIINIGNTLTLPYKSGTLATTSDFPIKSATLSGTTLSITLS